jgi:hypothetical protein
MQQNSRGWILLEVSLGLLADSASHCEKIISTKVKFLSKLPYDFLREDATIVLDVGQIGWSELELLRRISKYKICSSSCIADAVMPCSSCQPISLA